MEWSKQAEDMVKSWADVQKKMWEGWLTPLKDLPAGAGDTEYQKNLAAWEASVKRALEAQVEWTRKWAEGLSAGRAGSEAAAGMAQQAHEMMKLWTDAHRQLWENWFNTLKQMDPSRAVGAGAWEQEAQKVYQVWQEAAKSSQEAMSRWTEVWAKRR
jgi:hypothetical protein